MISPKFKHLARVDEMEANIGIQEEDSDDDDGVEEYNMEEAHPQNSSNIIIMPTTEETDNHLRVYLFPSEICQSYFEGRNGSNACSLITLILAHHFLAKEVKIPTGISDSLAVGWIEEVCHSTRMGKRIYDIFQGSSSLRSRYLAVNEACDLLVEWTPVKVNWIVQEHNLFSSGELYRQLVKLPSNQSSEHVASTFVCEHKTTLFLIDNEYIMFLDTHAHEDKGTLLIVSPKSHLQQFATVVEGTLEINNKYGELSLIYI